MAIADTGRTLVRPLAILALVAGVAGLPGKALAIDSESGTGRGEAPLLRFVSVDELLRLNDQTLYALSLGRNVSIEGTMERFDKFTLLNAIRFAPDRTRRLVTRIERARTNRQAHEIVRGLMKSIERRHGTGSRRVELAPESVETGMFYSLLQDMNNSYRREEQRIESGRKAIRSIGIF